MFRRVAELKARGEPLIALSVGEPDFAPPAEIVAATAKAGEEDGHGLIGGSCIVAPTGEIMAQALSEADEVIAFDCDLDLCDHYKRSVFAFEKHRRIEHYGLITSQTGAVPPLE